ncbi:MAG: molybdopterin-dependent oxidoreductase, partial [Xanthomonadales bacterium]|nr:molybdopterin-dependent oxidoreductase [Xanthomonadales bacterium]
MASKTNKLFPTCSHWGNYLVETDGAAITAIHPVSEDPNPSPIGQSLLDSLDKNVRIPQPMVRAGYLEREWNSDSSQRGIEPFVPVSWRNATELAARALQRTKDKFGNEAIYGGSYGWGSAGRFHHSQSQLHRFLNLFGGYTYSVASYSTAAAQAIMPHVVGISFLQLVFQAPTSEDIVKHTKTMLLFGGAAMKNTQVNAGGLGAHTARKQLRAMADSGVRMVCVSPVRDDVGTDHNGTFIDPEWWPCRPNSDVAIMLGLAHTLVAEDLYDKDFLARYTVGFERFLPYLMGETDGRPKDAEWAENLSDIPAVDIRQMARDLASRRSVLGISWSLQRQRFGEQPYWMITTLGAMLGDIGKPGGGVAYGYGCIHNMGFLGRKLPPFKLGKLPQGKNPVATHIPVARISDMLLNPGETIDFNGKRVTYPDIHLVYWAGGNPFHHHQDLNRLRKAWQKPGTIIVNEQVWNTTARMADIVFPITTALERNDIGGSSYDHWFSPMKKAVEPFARSRSDFESLAGIARELGFEEQFTENRGEMQWVKHLYETTRSNAEKRDISMPSFDEFWAGGQFTIEPKVPDTRFPLEKFRDDPEKYPLKTPSGKIEIFSDTIEGFDYDDCGGHPMWFEKDEFIGSRRSETYALHLVSNQPKTRLHSQMDHGVTSREAKIKGREVVRINPADA